MDDSNEYLEQQFTRKSIHVEHLRKYANHSFKVGYDAELEEKMFEAYQDISNSPNSSASKTKDGPVVSSKFIKDYISNMTIT